MSLSPADPTVQPATYITPANHNIDINDNQYNQPITGSTANTSTATSPAYNNKAAAYTNDADGVRSPIGDLSAYRTGMYTPYQALWGGFGIFNQVTSVLVNFFVNVGAQYAGAYGHDWVGVWSTPPTPNPYGLQVWSDFLMTSILVVAGMGLLATPGQWASIWMGQARPIPGKYCTGPNAHWYWKMAPSAFYPKGARNFLIRTILMVLQFSTVYYGVMMLIFFGMCKSNNIFAGPGESVGSNPGRGQDPQCWIDPVIYIWVRAAVFTVQGIFVYPIAYVAALDVDNVPAWALTAWKSKIEQKQGKPIEHVNNSQDNYSPESTTRTDMA